MVFDEWDNHPTATDSYSAWDGFCLIAMDNIPALEQFMEKHQRVLFYKGTEEIGEICIRNASLFSPIEDWKVHLDLLKSAKVIGISAALVRLRKRRF